MAEQLISFGSFVQGGLINDEDVEVTESSCVMFDYDGNMPNEICCVRLALKDSRGEEHENHWSLGGKEGDFVPTKNGKSMKSPTGKTSLNKGSNFNLLVQSLEDCGMPEGFLGTDLSVLVGLKGHVIRKPAPVRNIEGSKPKKEGDRPAEVLVFSDVKKAPWDKGGKGRSTKPAAASSDDSDGNDSEDGDFDATVSKLVVKAVLGSGGEMDFDDLGMSVFQLASKMSKSDRGKIGPLMQDADYVNNIDGISVEGGKVKAG